VAAFFDLLLLRSRLGEATLAAAVGAFLEDFDAVWGFSKWAGEFNVDVRSGADLLHKTHLSCR